MGVLSENRIIKNTSIAFYKADYKRWVQIKLMDVMYIDTLSKQSTRFVFKDLLVINTQEPLTKIISILPWQFMRIHRSRVVNIDYVDYFDYRKKVIVLKNGDKLKLSLSYNENIDKYSI